ncbi:hypothetical protein MTR67_013041 [Solanum verrucosum]|uniref:Uncharacterized protein n=1 Tax=Solanum verrucosum TaxID=315347 RepID=A0AAF0THJ8_SOLVR|nr:hypothetical protein MTR67_013041 [Solanum verrucosum]
MSSSSHHHFVLCLFLLSFLFVNSQSSYDAFVVILKNETPSMVTNECCINEIYPVEGEISIKPGGAVNITTTSLWRKHTCMCLCIRGKHGLYKLFDLNETSICHIPSEECLWKIQEDGLCMFSKGRCVMFGWQSSLSLRHINSEPTKYIASDEHNI